MPLHDEPVRLAMWSGPRNISTAMMRSWETRGDAFVSDEPLYAHYLADTGLPHPGAGEIMAHHETDWRKVVAWLTGPVPGGKAIFYQKHMAHHLLPSIELDWIDQLTNALLIRDPREMITSLVKVIPEPRLEDTGLPQQRGLFDRLRAGAHGAPIVLDAREVLKDPATMLEAVCAHVGVPFSAGMLSWETGPRATDGIWARHWYDAVHASTGFAPYRPKSDPVPAHLDELHRSCQAIYDELYAHRLVV